MHRVRRLSRRQEYFALDDPAEVVVGNFTPAKELSASAMDDADERVPDMQNRLNG